MSIHEAIRGAQPEPQSIRRGQHPSSLLAALAIVLLATSAAAARGPGGLHPGPGHPPGPEAARPELGPLVSGTISYISGTFVWTDYAYDDRGANTVETSIIGPRGAAPGTAARSGGDAVYPEWAEPGNVADLIQLQIGESRGALEIRALLETLVDPALPILAIAFDTDANPATGAATLPGGSWPSLDPLGIDRIAVVRETGAELLGFDGGAWSRIVSLDVDIDAEANTMDARIPLGFFPRKGESWRAFGLLGIVDPATGGSFLDGSQPIFDLAFVGGEPQVQWQEMKQSDVLVGALSSTVAAVTIDRIKMQKRRTELVDERAPGFKTFLYRSALDLPEGVTQPAPEVSLGQHEYLGPYQPYQVFVPETIPEGNPLLVSLHGSNNNHMISIFTVPLGAYVGTSREQSEDPFLISMFVPDFGFNGKTADTAKIFPLGRGETLGYAGIGEIDVLEATADAVRRLGVDPDRVTLQGDSMGGFGAYRLGTRYPDLWAALIPVIGHGAANRNLFENLGNLPIYQVNGANDPLVSYSAALEDVALLDALEIPFVFYGLLDRGHDPSANSQCVRDNAKHYVRDTNPADIVYVVDPATFQIDPERDLEIVYDSAYWLSGIELADATSEGSARASSHALPRTMDSIVRSDQILGNTVGAFDLCGPNPPLRTRLESCLSQRRELAGDLAPARPRRARAPFAADRSHAHERRRHRDRPRSRRLRTGTERSNRGVYRLPRHADARRSPARPAGLAHRCTARAHAPPRDPVDRVAAGRPHDPIRPLRRRGSNRECVSLSDPIGEEGQHTSSPVARARAQKRYCSPARIDM